jgi:hypothetical protein
MPRLDAMAAWFQRFAMSSATQSERGGSRRAASACPATSRSRTARSCWPRWPTASRIERLPGRRGHPRDRGDLPRSWACASRRPSPGVRIVHGVGMHGLQRRAGRWTAATPAPACACWPACWRGRRSTACWSATPRCRSGRCAASPIRWRGWARASTPRRAACRRCASTAAALQGIDYEPRRSPARRSSRRCCWPACMPTAEPPCANRTRPATTPSACWPRSAWPVEFSPGRGKRCVGGQRLRARDMRGAGGLLLGRVLPRRREPGAGLGTALRDGSASIRAAPACCTCCG